MTDIEDILPNAEKVLAGQAELQDFEQVISRHNEWMIARNDFFQQVNKLAARVECYHSEERIQNDQDQYDDGEVSLDRGLDTNDEDFEAQSDWTLFDMRSPLASNISEDINMDCMDDADVDSDLELVEFCSLRYLPVGIRPLMSGSGDHKWPFI